MDPTLFQTLNLEQLFQNPDTAPCKGYNTLAAVRIEDVVEQLRRTEEYIQLMPHKSTRGHFYVNLNGYTIKMSSERLRTYYKGLECMLCRKVRAQIAFLQTNGSNNPHLNLYGFRTDDYQLLMLTSDHIIPQSRGGAKKCVTNLQPACCKCNSKKGDKLPGETESPRMVYGRRQHEYGVELCGVKKSLAYHAEDTEPVKGLKLAITRESIRVKMVANRVLQGRFETKHVVEKHFPDIHTLLSSPEAKWGLTIVEMHKTLATLRGLRKGPHELLVKPIIQKDVVPS